MKKKLYFFKNHTSKFEDNKIKHLIFDNELLKKKFLEGEKNPSNLF